MVRTAQFFLDPLTDIQQRLRCDITLKTNHLVQKSRAGKPDRFGLQKAGTNQADIQFFCEQLSCNAQIFSTIAKI